MGPSGHPRDVPVEIMACKQQKPALGVLGRIRVYGKDMYWLTEWTGRRKSRWEKMSVKQTWAWKAAAAQRSQLGFP